MYTSYSSIILEGSEGNGLYSFFNRNLYIHIYIYIFIYIYMYTLSSALIDIRENSLLNFLNLK